MFVNNLIAGMKVYVDRRLCEYRFLRWVKTHRRSRIAKKYRKKYGAIFAPCPGKSYRIAEAVLIMCPHVKTELEWQIAKVKE